jgi:hypothetical protein
MTLGRGVPNARMDPRNIQIERPFKPTLALSTVKPTRRLKVMKKMLACTGLLLASSAFAAGATPLTGQWTIHSSIAGNESDMTCNFTQTDAKLTGTCKSGDKDIPITGSVDGGKVTWKYDTEHDGTPLTLTYTATVSDSGKISGSVDVAPYSITGDFTATPSKDPSK